MKGLVVEKDLTLAVADLPDPAINECMAKVKTVACGICGTDAKLLHGNFKLVGMDQYPLVLGHEAVGQVVEVGSSVTSYKEGDYVLMPYNFVPGGGYGAAWGAFAEYGLIYDYAAWDEMKYGPKPLFGLGQNVLPDWVDPVDAIMIITLRETLAACRTFGFDANESIVIYGCGPVGLSFIKNCRMRGMKPIIALDLVDDKLQEALDQGADYAFNSKDPDHIKKIKEICPDGLDNVLDAVGVNELMTEAMGLIKDVGKISVYGIDSRLNTDLNWSASNYNWSIVFQQMPDKRDEYWAHNQVMAWLEYGVYDLKDYISDYFPFSEVIPAMERFGNKEFKKKTIITF